MTETLLAGRVAFVTGAASGIGAATVRLLASRGATVCCADIDGVGAQTVAKGILADGGEAFAYALDVADREGNVAAVEAVRDRCGALHIAVLNAGIESFGPILDVTAAEWERGVGVNLTGVFLGIQSTGRLISQSGGGSVIVTSSVLGLVGMAAMSTYAATKHGVLGLVKCAAVDLAKFGIRVNAICPGGIDTPIMGPLHGNAALLDEVVGKRHPIGRVGQAEEVARVVAFLASDESSFMTGAVIPVDGGVSSTTPGFDDAMALVDADDR